jgi:hypothetical protein
MGQRAYNALFTAETVEPRTAKDGKPYLRARGTIENRDGTVIRTVLVQGSGYDAVAPHMRVGIPLALRGFYRRVEKDGRQGGQFFSAFGLTSAKRGPGIPSAGARTSSSGVVRAPDREAVVVDLAKARIDASRPSGRTSIGHRRPAPLPAFEEGDLLLTPLEQLSEDQRPPAPTVEELAAADAPRPQQPSTMLIDGVETEISEDWTGAAPRTISGHEREGYWRRQHHGPRNSLVKVIWIGSSRVNGGSRSPAMPEMALDLD